jgi:formylglycine-generating enzyme required for sulfatase activity
MRGLITLALFALSACGSNRGSGGARSAAARASMAAIARGAFIAGGPARPVVGAEVAASPRHSRELQAFAIDRVPVTERDYSRFVEETARAVSAVAVDADATVTPAQLARRALPQRARAALYSAHPAVLVSWDDARDYCAWRGARLAAEDEWEKALRGVDGRVFPWGDRVDPERINSRELGPGDTAPVLSYPRAASPFEVYDGAGNAAEWTSTPGPSPDHFIVRGSAWNEPAALARLDRRRQLPRSARSVTLTFRCAATPPP